jgi:hypothetical protein
MTNSKTVNCFAKQWNILQTHILHEDQMSWNFSMALCLLDTLCPLYDPCSPLRFSDQSPPRGPPEPFSTHIHRCNSESPKNNFSSSNYYVYLHLRVTKCFQARTWFLTALLFGMAVFEKMVAHTQCIMDAKTIRPLTNRPRDNSTHTIHPPNELSAVTIHPCDILTPIWSVQVFFIHPALRWMVCHM